MPNLDITPEEAKGVVAFLKWMSVLILMASLIISPLSTQRMTNMSATPETAEQNSSSLKGKLQALHSWAGVDDSTLNDGQKLAVKYFMGAVILFIFSDFIWLACWSTIYSARLSVRYSRL